MEFCEHDPVPEVYKYWTAVSALAGAVQHKVWYSPNGFMFEYPNLYIMLIGDINTGKSTCARHAVNMLSSVSGFYKVAGKLTEASFIGEIIDAGKLNSFTFNGITYKSGAVFLYASEASKAFAEMGRGNKIVNLITDYYNTCEHNFWSKQPFDSKLTKSHGREEMFNPCINLLACSTVHWLMGRVLTKEDLEGGLGSRFIFAAHDGPIVRKATVPGVAKSRAILFEKLVDDLKEIAQLSGNMLAEPSFFEQHVQYQTEHDQRLLKLKQSDPVLWSCVNRKASTLVLRLSMLLAIDERDCVVAPEHVSLKIRHMQKAWKILTEAESRLPDVLGQYSVEDKVKPRQAVIAYIRNTGVKEVRYHELLEIFSKRCLVTEFRSIWMELVTLKIIVLSPKATPSDRLYMVL